MDNTKNNPATRALPFPEERFKDYLSLIGVFNEQGRVDEETKALSYQKLTGLLTLGGREQVLIMALGDWREGNLLFDDFAAIAEWFFQNRHRDGNLGERQSGITWAIIAARRKERDNFYKTLDLCVNLDNEAYLAAHSLSRDAAVQKLTSYYEKNKDLDWRDRRNIPENER